MNSLDEFSPLLQVGPDETVEVSYTDLSAKTIKEIWELLSARKLLHAKPRNGFIKSDIKDENIS